MYLLLQPQNLKIQPIIKVTPYNHKLCREKEREKKTKADISERRYTLCQRELTPTLSRTNIGVRPEEGRANLGVASYHPCVVIHLHLACLPTPKMNKGERVGTPPPLPKRWGQMSLIKHEEGGWTDLL